MPMRLCGCRFASEEEARNSLRAKQLGAEVGECADRRRCGGWHVRNPKPSRLLRQEPRGQRYRSGPRPFRCGQRPRNRGTCESPMNKYSPPRCSEHRDGPRSHSRTTEREI